MKRSPKVITITSGKGGVGKTNLSVNLSAQLAKKGKRVLLLDADLGLANVDVLLGIAPQKNIFHLFQENAALEDVIINTPYNFSILPASSGINEVFTLTAGQKMTLLDELDALDNSLDYLIVDTGAGINDNVLYFSIASQERIIVLTSEPTSLTDAYALIKVLNSQYDITQFKVVVNMVQSERHAKDVFARLSSACDHFLNNVSLDYFGFMPKDPYVRQAVIAQKPFEFLYPTCPASVALDSITSQLLKLTPTKQSDGNIKFFWKKLLFQE